MQHQMKCEYISEVYTHHECVHCFSFEVTHTTYQIHTYVRTYVSIVCHYAYKAS